VAGLLGPAARLEKKSANIADAQVGSSWRASPSSAHAAWRAAINVLPICAPLCWEDVG